METNDRVLHTIRALLAKAESTDYPDEAAALTAKAQQLISAHAIDLALIEERTGRGEVVTRVLFIPAPYPKEKSLLLGGVARANGCRAILGIDEASFKEMFESGEMFSRPGNHATLVGHESDLDSVELLFTSLLVQAVNSMLAHGAQVDASGASRTKSFRRSFLNGFAHSVSVRLKDARDAAAESAQSEAETTEGDSTDCVLPVLASREASVDDFVDKRFPSLGSLKTSVSNYAGIVAGNTAGDRADLGGTRFSSSRRALQ